MLLNIIVGMLSLGFIGLGVCVYSLMNETKVKSKNMKRVNLHANKEYNKIYNEKIKGYKNMNEVQRSKVTYDIITDFSGKIEDLHYENIFLNNRLESMDREFKEFRNEMNIKLNKLQEENYELKSRVNKLQEENYELKSRIYNLERENSGQDKYITNVVDKLKHASLNLR